MVATASVPHNTIIDQAIARGSFEEGIINDTSKPGTIMQIDTSVTPLGNRLGWKAANSGTDGKDVLAAVLMEDSLQGKTTADAYVAGTLGRIYFVQPGETFLARVGEVAGTGNSYAVGDRLIMDAEDGLLVPDTGSPQACFAIAVDTLTQVQGGALLAVKKI